MLTHLSKDTVTTFSKLDIVWSVTNVGQIGEDFMVSLYLKEILLYKLILRIFREDLLFNSYADGLMFGILWHKFFR